MIQSMDLNIVNEFIVRSRESEKVIKDLYIRLMEDEYARLRTNFQVQGDGDSDSSICTQIINLAKYICENCSTLPRRSNELHLEVHTLTCLLRNQLVKI